MKIRLFSLWKLLRKVLYHNEVVNQQGGRHSIQETRHRHKRGERNSQEDGEVRFLDDYLEHHRKQLGKASTVRKASGVISSR